MSLLHCPSAFPPFLVLPHTPTCTADDAIAKLGDIGLRTSLRYAVQLLTPARIMATTQGREKITADDVDEVDGLFYDAKASAQVLVEQSSKYLL